MPDGAGDSSDDDSDSIGVGSDEEDAAVELAKQTKGQQPGFIVSDSESGESSEEDDEDGSSEDDEDGSNPFATNFG